jgi:hypothetical protein
MIVSREEAVGVFRKWATDKTPVSVVVIAGGMSVCFSGFITIILSNSMAVIHHNKAGEKIAELVVGLEMADSFDYSDVREADPAIRGRLEKRVVSSVAIRSNGAQCNLIELVA